MDPISDRGVEKPLFLNGTYEAGTLDIIGKCLKKDDIFIDVGANIGLMSIFASRIVRPNGIIYSFEPEPETFMILNKNIAINKIKNIRAYNIGVGERQYKSVIFTNPYAGRGGASLIKPFNQKDSIKYEIYIEKLDDIIFEYNIKKIRMLKIDVEGWELNVLKGAKFLLQSIEAPIICIEFCIEYSKIVKSLKNIHLTDIYNYILMINEYRIYKLKYGKGNPSKLIKIKSAEDLPYHDNLFCFLPKHLEDIPRNVFDEKNNY